MPELLSTYTPMFVMAVDSQSHGLVEFMHKNALWIVFPVMAVTAGLILLFAERFKRIAPPKQGGLRPQSGTTSVSIFEELCACHELNDEERSLLESASESTADSAAHLFVDPQPLRQLASETNDARYGDLVNRLFPESTATPA